jgi:hypothetical protein
MTSKQREALRNRVVRMRDQKNMSWAAIGEAIHRSAGTARRLYDEQCGPGAHAGRLPGKGGRLAA